MAELTPDEKLDRLADLLGYMADTKRQVNMAIAPPENGDVAKLALVGNGDGWEAVCETGTYDLWYVKEEGGADLIESDLTKEQAGDRLLDEYEKSKAERVAARWESERGMPFTTKERQDAINEIRAQIRKDGMEGTIEIRSQISKPPMTPEEKREHFNKINAVRIAKRGPYGTNEGDTWLATGSPVQDRLDADGEGMVLIHEMMVKDGKLQECMYVTANPEMIADAERGHELYLAEQAARN